MADSPLLRFPSLAREIGPVVAASRRLASRYSNALRAGSAADAAALADCRLILIHVPPIEVPAALGFLLAAHLPCHCRPVVLLDPHPDHSALTPLRVLHVPLGIATFAPGQPVMVCEGHPLALSALRTWAAAGKVRSLAIKPGAMSLYSAGLTAAETLVTPMLECALRSMHAAGVGHRESHLLIGGVVQDAIRSYQAHGRKSWANPASPARRRALQVQLTALRAVDSRLADFFHSSLEMVLEFYKRPPLQKS